MNQATDQVPAPKIVGAVANAFSILRVLAQAGEPMGVATVARATNMSVSTCFNILRTLASERLVEFDGDAKTYRLGAGMLEFSVPLLGVNQIDLIRPELQRLSADHNSLICLWQITETERVVLVDRIATGRNVRVDMPLGARLPVYVGAVGRCYAALAGLEQRDLKEKFEGLQWQDSPTFDDYLADVRRAAVDGYAFDLGKLFVGVEIAASIVTDASRKTRLGISGINIANQLPRDDLERLAVDIRNSADWISETLFGVSMGVRQADRRAATPGPDPTPNQRPAS
ncbi:transcriptional regulator, IclR family [Roseovarius pacificus]|uniref:Transcriptional regulator, IclR family n=1 Tax=Roseovarius pacificus TaxID=337701 RepID=A0A1M7KIB4_9RHOB|nr:IclR family transcriptional regulator [Roseovarius pacificus]SHM64827.1 transcriptional regulator, IclR family [Roseovarius pacificus]